MAVKVINDLCRGCTICVKKCPFDAIAMEGKLAVIGEACTNCGVCVSACPFKAIMQEEMEKEKEDLSLYQDVWVFAEQRESKVMPVVYELLGEGRKLADQRQSKLCALLCGYQMSHQIEDLIAHGADVVYVADHEELRTYTTDGYSKVFHEAIKKYKPEIVLLGATHIGRDLGPSIAVKSSTGLTADCTSLEIDPEDGKLRQTRPAFGGNLMATIICPDTRPQMSTVRPGVMDKALFDPEHKGEVVRLDVAFQPDEIRTKVLKTVKSLAKQVSLSDADIIVAGGMGIGNKEGFKLLEELAEKLGGTVAASRACVDAGWIEHQYQVGQTGTTVKPTLYFAFGISGAIQHIAGMKDSDYIIAVNKNQDAPIFEVADYGIVGDLYQVIPGLIDEIERIAL